MNLRSHICAFLFSTLIAATAQAQTHYWVSVASYENQNRAMSYLDAAEEAVRQPFEVLGFVTDQGYFYRLVSGPYLTLELAQDLVATAVRQGFPGAWYWSEEDVSHSTGVLTEGPTSQAEPEPLPRNQPQLVPPSSSAKKKADRVVDEAPDGYQLHKLRREASSQTGFDSLSLAGLTGFVPDALLQNQFGSPGFVVGAVATPTQTEAAEALVSALAAEPELTTAPPNQLMLANPAGPPITLPSFREADIDVQIDGDLSESAWRVNPGVDTFRVVDPDTGDVPRHATLVKMFYTERGLYAAFEMEQPPETLVRVFSGRDDGRLNRDNVGVTLDTSGEGRYGYWVNLALGGNQVDGTVLPERQFSRDWDGAWYGATKVTTKGWNAEIFLPWSQVAMPREAGRRVVNAYASRKVAYMDERYAVPALPFTQPLFMSALQPLLLDQVDPQQQFSFFPYVSITQDEVEDFTQTKAGADIFWRPSTNLQLTTTLNPDFGNVESDEVIVNLSAFEVFFPERRLFFQEGTEIFDTTPRADGGEPTTVVNTRRIGGQAREPDVPDDVDVPARELGQPVELMGAVKAVGQFGQVRYGLLAASENEVKFDVDDINYYQEGSDYGIARFLYEDKSASGAYRAIGTITTLVAHPEEDALVNGIDYHYLTPGGKWKVDGQLLHSEVDDEGSGVGAFVDVGYTIRRGMNLRWGLSHFDDRFELNDLGFNRRNDATATSLQLDYERSDLPWFRKAAADSFLQYEVNGDGERTRIGIGTNFGLDLRSQDQIRAGIAYFPASAEDRNSRDNGTYEVEGRHNFYADYFTDTAQRMSYRFGMEHGGEELGGSRMVGRLGFTWRPIDQINIGALAQYQRRRGWLLWQEDRNFTTFNSTEWRPRINLDYFLTAKQQLRFSAQWVGIRAKEQGFYLVPEEVGELEEIAKPDAETDDFAISRVNVQLRYRWEIAPLSELSVVYTLSGAQSEDSGGFQDLLRDAYDDPVGEQLIIKLRYRLGS
ncbi:MAG: DUF5916 domain-containing protein [bacterium]